MFESPSTIPPIGDGESIPSHVMKMRLLDDVPGKGGSLLRRGINMGFLSSPVPKNLAQYVELVTPLFDSVEQARDKATNLPLFGLSMREDQFRAIEQHCMGMSKRGNLKYWVHNSSRDNVPAWCPSCAVADRRRYGIAYWHREHQLLGIDFCIIDGDRLVTACGGCSYSRLDSKRTAFPSSTCHCGRWAKCKSSFQNEALEANVFHAERHYIREILARPERWRFFLDDVSRALPIALARNEIRDASALGALFEGVYGAHSLEAFRARFRLSERWMAHLVRQHRPPCSVVAMLAVLATLFDSPNELSFALQRGRRADSEFTRASSRLATIHSTAGCLDYGPLVRQKAAGGIKPNSDRRPLIEGMRRIKERQNKEDDARFLHLIEEQIRLQTPGCGEPERMFVTYLARTCTYTGSYILAHPDRFPKSAARIMEARESSKDWNVRRLLLILRGGDAVTSRQNLLTYAAESTRMRLGAVLKVIEETDDLHHLLAFA